MGDKKLMYCLKCGHEFLSTAELPRCSHCHTTRVIDHKEVSTKKDVLNLKHRLNQLEQEFTELEYEVAELRRGSVSAMQCIEDNRSLISQLIKR